MKELLTFFILLCCAQVVMAAPKPGGKAAVDQQPGMIITGDQEAPLVMYIVPWQEAKPQASPEAPLQPLLPPVLDYNRSLIEDPLNLVGGLRSR